MQPNENESFCPTCGCHGHPAKTQKMQLIRTGEASLAGSTVDLRHLDPGWQVRGNRVSFLGPRDFVENVSVFVNGVLQLNGMAPGVGINDVYFIARPDRFAFRFPIMPGDVVHVWNESPK